MFETDLIWNSMNTLFGSTIIVVMLVIITLFVLFWMSRIPIYYTLLFSIPALIGIANMGMFPDWVQNFMWMVIGLIFGMIVLRLYTDVTSFW
jgi:hypothetical protein